MRGFKYPHTYNIDVMQVRNRMSGSSFENVVGSNVFSPEVGGDCAPPATPTYMIFFGAIAMPCKLHQNEQHGIAHSPSAWRPRKYAGKETNCTHNAKQSYQRRVASYKFSNSSMFLHMGGGSRRLTNPRSSCNASTIPRRPIKRFVPQIFPHVFAKGGELRPPPKAPAVWKGCLPRRGPSTVSLCKRKLPFRVFTACPGARICSLIGAPDAVIC